MTTASAVFGKFAQNKYGVNGSKVTLTGMFDAEEEKTAAPAKRAIVFVIDISGSMSGGRLENVRRSVIPFVEEISGKSDTVMALIPFCHYATSQILASDSATAKQQMDNALRATGGTSFREASKEMVKVCGDILTKYVGYEITTIVCSDGETDKRDAQDAQQIWKDFVDNTYRKQMGQYPFVESIGIGTNHDADILDGFICHDDAGNYSRTTSVEEIEEVFNRAAEAAALRKTYKLSIQSNMPILTNLYTDSADKTHEMVVTDNEFAVSLWLANVAVPKLELTLNDKAIKVEVEEIGDAGRIQEMSLEYYSRWIGDMIGHLRGFQDEATLKKEAGKIQNDLDSNAQLFESLTAVPANQEKIVADLAQLLEACEGDKIEERAQKLRNYKKQRLEWRAHGKLTRGFTETLAALKTLLSEILTGATRLQEIRQHIIGLHFQKKHAKRLNKLIMTEEQLAKRQRWYDSLEAPTAEECKDLSEGLGSGCFLSTLSEKEVAADGEALWICGRVNRKGGSAVSNPELIRIQYISVNLVCQSYFDMAMEARPDGFFDASRELINSRLFPVYANSAHCKATSPFLAEAYSHTLTGRNDISVPDFSTLSAVVGHYIAGIPPSTIHLNTLFNTILPSYQMITKKLKSRPYKSPNNKEPDTSADRIPVFELFGERLSRYVKTMKCRCSSMVTNVECLFGDALLVNNGHDYSAVVNNAPLWLSFILQRLCGLSRSLVPKDPDLWTEARLAEQNLRDVLRVLVRGDTQEWNATSKPSDEDHKAEDEEDTKEQKLDLDLEPYRCSKDGPIQYTSLFKVPTQFPTMETEDLAMWDAELKEGFPQQMDVVRQMLGRISFRNLIRAHRFFRICHDAREKQLSVAELVELLRTDEKFDDTIEAFAAEIGWKVDPLVLRALCGFATLYSTNKLFQSMSELAEEIFESPRAVLQQFHETVTAESRRKPRRLVQRVKAKPKHAVDFAKRHPKANLFQFENTDNDSDYWQKVKDIEKKPFLIVSCVGSTLTDKSHILGRLLFDLGAVSQKRLTDLFGKDAKPTEYDFSKVMHRDVDLLKRGVIAQHTRLVSEDFLMNIVDSPLPQFHKTLMKTIAAADVAVLFVSAAKGAFEADIAALDNKKGQPMGMARKLPILSQAMGVTKLIVCVTAMDDKTVNYAEKRYTEIVTELSALLSKKGLQTKRIPFIPVAVTNGDNLNTVSTAMQWYKGFSLQSGKNKPTFEGKTLIDAFALMGKVYSKEFTKRHSSNNKPLRAVVNGVYKLKGVGMVGGMRVIQGTLKIGDKLTVIPTNTTGEVQSIYRNEMSVKEALPGDNIGVHITGIAANQPLINGDICVLAGDDKSGIIKSMKIETELIVSNWDYRIRANFSSTMYFGSGERVAATLTKILEKSNIKSGKAEKGPLFLEKNEKATVVWTLQKPVAVSKFEDLNNSGRFVVMLSGNPVMMGKVTKPKA